METELERMSTSQDTALVVQGNVEQENVEQGDLDRQRDEQHTQYRTRMKEEWSQTPHGRLCVELYQKFVEYAVHLEQHPDARQRPDGKEIDFKEHRLFENALFLVNHHILKREKRDRKNLEK